MDQGIAALNPTQAPEMGGAQDEAANALGSGFSSLSPAELEKLRELQDDLSELSPDKLKVLEQILQFLKKNKERYDDAVMMLVSKGVVEPGDLPPDYVPAFFEILEQMVKQAMSGEQEGYAKGGLAALRKKAQAVRKAGTGGDKVLAHINPREAAMLQATRGGGTNPNTGLPEYGFFDDIGGFLKKAAPVILPVALNFLVPGLGAIASGAIGSGIGAMINGASPGEALKAAALGGATGAVFSGVQGMMKPGGTFMGGVQAGLPGAGTYSTPVQPTSAVSTQTGKGLEVAARSGSNQFTAPEAPGIFDKVGNFVKENPMTSLGIAGLGGAALASAMQPEQGGEAPSLPAGATAEQIQAARFAPGSFTQRVAPRYNFVPTMYAAQGGELDARIGGHLEGPGTGTSDSIPARLSDGEFVMTAKAVRGAGNGSRKAGAKKMYDLMHQFEKRA
jgi:hypothetical protein